jgi:apolipoprotein N-acyltransferase
MMAQYMPLHRGRKAVLALAAGAALGVAQPGLPFGALVFILFVPLLAVTRRHGFLPGLAAGFGFSLVSLRWLFTLFRFDALVIPGVLVLCVYLGLYFGILFALLGLARRRFGEPILLVLAPIGMALLEIVRSLGPLGVSFSSLYLSLYRYPPLVQIAAVLGPWAVTAAIVFVNTALYLAWRRRNLRYLAAGAGMIAALLAFGLVSLPPAGAPLRVAVVSSDVPQAVKLDEGNLQALLARYLALGGQAAELHPGLIVFPESILPGYILRDQALLPGFERLAAGSGAAVLLGTGDYRDRRIYNSVALLSPQGRIAGIYDMVHPVPFGETIPGRSLLDAIGLGGWVKRFLPMDVTPGAGHTPLAGIGTPICFESTFPGPSRAFVRHGASLLVTVTNDAWFGASSELAAHFACGVFRAVETRRTLIQAANGGISGVIGPRGRVLEKRRGEGVFEATVIRRTGLSAYTRWGNAPLLWGFLALSAGAVGWGETKRWTNR